MYVLFLLVVSNGPRTPIWRIANSTSKQFSGLVIRGLGYSVDESILLGIPPGIGS
jgi:hypothetical protein